MQTIHPLVLLKKECKDINDYGPFLMTKLKETLKDQNESGRLYQALILIAGAGEKISETMLQMYLAPLFKDEELFEEQVGKFCGWDLIDIVCDCETPNNTNCLRYKILSSDPYAFYFERDDDPVNIMLHEEINKIRVHFGLV